MVVIKANITPGDELQTPRSWKVIAGSSQPPYRKRTIFVDQKGSSSSSDGACGAGKLGSGLVHCPVAHLGTFTTTMSLTCYFLLPCLLPTSLALLEASAPTQSGEQATGAVHIGQNSMVFYDSAGAIGNGKDIMASSVGKIQIGKMNTDVTSFVGEVNVPEPTKPTHAVTKQYADSTAAMSMAMASAVDANSDGNHMGFGFGDYAGQTAMAVGVSLQYEKTKLKIIASQSESMKEPAFSGGFSWSF